MSEREITPGPEASASRRPDRRAFVRISSEMAVTCRPAGRFRDAGWSGTVRDISMGGVGLLLRHCFLPGTTLTVELWDSAGELRRTAHVRVVHATAVLVDGLDCWFLGCSFDQPLSEEEFRRAYWTLAAQRNTRILGVFTRLWKRDNKPGYRRFQPRMWGLLERDLAQPHLKPVRDWFDKNILAEHRREPWKEAA